MINSPANDQVMIDHTLCVPKSKFDQIQHEVFQYYSYCSKLTSKIKKLESQQPQSPKITRLKTELLSLQTLINAKEAKLATYKEKIRNYRVTILEQKSNIVKLANKNLKLEEKLGDAQENIKNLNRAQETATMNEQLNQQLIAAQNKKIESLREIIRDLQLQIDNKNTHSKKLEELTNQHQSQLTSQKEILERMNLFLGQLNLLQSSVDMDTDSNDNNPSSHLSSK